MITLNVPDMSCDHCKASVEAALTGVDPAARVAVDLDAGKVEVTSTASTPALIAALSAVGYPASLAI